MYGLIVLNLWITQITIKANYHHLTMLSVIFLVLHKLWLTSISTKTTKTYSKKYHRFPQILYRTCWMLTSTITISYCYILLTITHRPFKTLLAEVINLLLIVRPTNISEHYLLLIVFKPKITNLKFAYNLGFSLGKKHLNHPTPYLPSYFVFYVLRHHRWS